MSDLAAALSAAMAALNPPAVIVTAMSGGRRAGCLVTFSMQCSITPFRYVVAISRVNATYRVAAAAPTLAVHIPHDDGDGGVRLAELFGGRTGDEIDKLAHVAWEPWDDGTPLLQGCSWLVGPVVERVPLGDHVGMVVEPLAAGARTGARGLRLDDVRHVRPGHAL